MHTLSALLHPAYLFYCGERGAGGRKEKGRDDEQENERRRRAAATFTTHREPRPSSAGSRSFALYTGTKRGAERGSVDHRGSLRWPQSGDVATRTLLHGLLTIVALLRGHATLLRRVLWAR